MAKTNNDKPQSDKKEIAASLIEKPLSIDEIFVQDPNGYAAKFKPDARTMIIKYLNTRPMAQVEIFFSQMFEIADQDPFYRIEWIKRLFDYLKNTCPRGEAKDVILKLAHGTVLYKTSEKPVEKEDVGKKDTGKKEEDAGKK